MTRSDCELADPLPAHLRSDETIGNFLDAHLSLGDIQNEPKGVVIAEIDGFTVHIQEDCRGQPSQALVAINQRVAPDDRMQQSSRFEFDSRVGVFSESTRLRPDNSRIQKTEIFHRPNA